MIESEIFSLIGNVGFPIAITIFILVKLDKTLQKNTDAIHDLTVCLKGHGVDRHG